MYPLVEFCMSNVAEGTHSVMEELSRDPNIDVVERGCLGQCTMCRDHRYARVEGKIIKSQQTDELIDDIYQYLEEEEWL
ncbi:hypothetical protein DH09_14685 [Bacillaceae bacterium JMAK1]|nr:hypothetical protein DH09_14685 [Bacillaceae bacterium JMAK1]